MPNSVRYWRMVAAFERQARAEMRSRTATITSLRFGLNRKYFTPLHQREAAWRERGARYLSAGRYKGLRASWVTVDPALQADIINHIADVYPATAAALDQHLALQAIKAFTLWPEETGFSKMLLSLEYTISGTTVTGTFESRAPYTPFIRTSKTGLAGRDKFRAGGELTPGMQVIHRASEDGRVWDVYILPGRKRRFVVPAGQPLGEYLEQLTARQTANGKRRKKGGASPYQDQIVRPGRAIAAAVGRDIVAALGRE